MSGGMIDDQKCDMFKIVRRMVKANRDLITEQCIKNDETDEDKNSLDKLITKSFQSLSQTDTVRQEVDIDEMQFGFMQGCGTTKAIFILRQLQEKYLVKKKDLCFAFVDLGKAFDRVPRGVI